MYLEGPSTFTGLGQTSQMPGEKTDMGRVLATESGGADGCLNHCAKTSWKKFG